MVAATTGATLRDQDAPTRWRLRVGWVHGQGVFRNRQRRSSASDRPALPRERRLGVAWPIAATQRGRGVAATRVLAPGKRAHGKPRRFACPARARADQRSRSRPPALARRQKPACTPRRSRGRLRSGTVSRFRVRLPKGKPRFFVRQPSPRVCDTAPHAHRKQNAECCSANAPTAQRARGRSQRLALWRASFPRIQRIARPLLAARDCCERQPVRAERGNAIY